MGARERNVYLPLPQCTSQNIPLYVINGQTKAEQILLITFDVFICERHVKSGKTSPLPCQTSRTDNISDVFI